RTRTFVGQAFQPDGGRAVRLESLTYVGPQPTRETPGKGGGPMRLLYWVAFIVLCVVPLLLLRHHRAPGADPRWLPPRAVDPNEPYSNVLRGDYVGPAECARCHREKFERWSKHPHRRMNQLPGPDTVLGDFSGRVMKLGNASVAFATEKGAYLMRV